MKTKFTELTFPKQTACLFLIVGSVLFSQSLNAQQKNLIGISSSVEWGKGLGLRNVSGLTYERKFTNNFGIETGALFQNVRLYSDLSPVLMHKRDGARINSFHLHIPVLFKYYSNIVNIAAGPTFNIKLTDFRTGNLTREINYRYYKTPEDFGIGYQFKVSKSINIKDQFVLEPEVNVGNRFEFKKPSVGIGASFKYKF